MILPVVEPLRSPKSRVTDWARTAPPVTKKIVTTRKTPAASTILPRARTKRHGFPSVSSDGFRRKSACWKFSAGDACFHHRVGGAADQQQMLGRIAPDQNKTPPAINGNGLDHRKTLPPGPRARNNKIESPRENRQ